MTPERRQNAERDRNRNEFITICIGATSDRLYNYDQPKQTKPTNKLLKNQGKTTSKASGRNTVQWA